eukprot:1152732-Rhodomonas_salina.1
MRGRGRGGGLVGAPQVAEDGRRGGCRLLGEDVLARGERGEDRVGHGGDGEHELHHVHSRVRQKRVQ